MTISKAIELAAETLPPSATPEQKLEAVQSALTLCSRVNRFTVSWCLHFMEYQFTFIGKSAPDAPPKFRDDLTGFITDDPGTGVLAAYRVAESLIEFADNGGLLAIEHPEAGMEESHVPPCCELMVRCTKGAEDGRPPWATDFETWAAAGCPANFGEYLP